VYTGEKKLVDRKECFDVTAHAGLILEIHIYKSHALFNSFSKQSV